jgi:hypothetical protein
MAKIVTNRKAVWFYNLELALLADGGYHVSLTSTTVDERGFNFPAHRNLRASERVENLLG